MRRICFLESARNELAAASTYYDSQNPGLGQELVREVRRLCGSILDHPMAGSEIRPDIRRRLLRRFPFAILYSVDEDSILVIAMAHHRREPGYWHKRS